MNAKEAIATAKGELLDTFQGEGLAEVGLEEIEYDDREETWRVTIGFRRSWNRPVGQLAQALGSAAGRTYKVVALADRDGRLLSIKNRDVPAAA